MDNNLITKYLNNPNNFTQTQRQSKPSEKGYFPMPSVSSAMDSFDIETDKLVKPLDGKGHLVNENITSVPKEFVRDTVYTTKAFADGIRGKANDHQLGKMNDLGLKLGGIAIASYLMTRKTSPKTKAMEFIGFGAFLASMALWPKLALEIPAKMIHGFNFRKQYVDEQGRKKFVSQDPNYIPFDLYKGDKPSEDLDVIGDKAGIRRDIPNRHEAVKEHMRKVSVQNNTMWMLTAGIATPLMTALACNGAEKIVNPIFENYYNKKSNEVIFDVSRFLGGTLKGSEEAKFRTSTLGINEAEKTKTETLLHELKKDGRLLGEGDIDKIAESLSEGFDTQMTDAAKADVKDLFKGSIVYQTGSERAKGLANSLHTELSTALGAADPVVKNITPDALRKSIINGVLRGSVEDMLGKVATDVVDANPEFANGRLSSNLKKIKVGEIDFFEVTKETEHMSEPERLVHNIRKHIQKVNNSNPYEDFVAGMSELEGKNREFFGRVYEALGKGAETIVEDLEQGRTNLSGGREAYIRDSVEKLFTSVAPEEEIYCEVLEGNINKVIAGDVAANKGYRLSSATEGVLTGISKEFRKYDAIDRVLTESAHFKVAEAPETIVANNWEQVTNTFLRKLNISGKDLERASRDEEFSYELLSERLENVCRDKESYSDLLKSLGEDMAMLDEKLDAPTKNANGRIMSELETGIGMNCDETGSVLRRNSMHRMADRMLGVNAWGKDVGDIGDAGSIKRLKTEKIRSRVNGVHSSYTRLLQTVEFFRRAHCYEYELEEGKLTLAELAKKYGLTENVETNRQIIRDGKKLLMSAGASEHYNKLGLTNNKNYFKALYRAVFNPKVKDGEREILAPFIQETVDILNGVKIKNNVPRRALEGQQRVPLGQKMVEHMAYIYKGLGSIARAVRDDCEVVNVGEGLKGSESLAYKRFDMIGKATSKFFHDTITQKANTKKWVKTFAPILGITYLATVGAQFLFGGKDKDIKLK